MIAHIFYLADAKDLLRAGIDGFAHGVRDKDVDDEFVKLIQMHPNVFVIPNLPDNPDAPLDATWIRETVPAAEFQKMQDALAKRTPKEEKTARDFFGVQARNLAKLNAAGVKIGFGTDSGTQVGWTVHMELADMVTAGMTPAQVLRAATKTAAEIVKLDQLGEVAPGKSADFLVLDANFRWRTSSTHAASPRLYLRGQELDRAAMRSTLIGQLRNSVGGADPQGPRATPRSPLWARENKTPTRGSSAEPVSALRRRAKLPLEALQLRLPDPLQQRQSRQVLRPFFLAIADFGDHQILAHLKLYNTTDLKTRVHLDINSLIGPAYKPACAVALSLRKTCDGHGLIE